MMVEMSVHKAWISAWLNECCIRMKLGKSCSHALGLLDSRADGLEHGGALHTVAADSEQDRPVRHDGRWMKLIHGNDFTN